MAKAATGRQRAARDTQRVSPPAQYEAGDADLTHGDILLEFRQLVLSMIAKSAVRLLDEAGVPTEAAGYIDTDPTRATQLLGPQYEGTSEQEREHIRRRRSDGEAPDWVETPLWGAARLLRAIAGIYDPADAYALPPVERRQRERAILAYSNAVFDAAQARAGTQWQLKGARQVSAERRKGTALPHTRVIKAIAAALLREGRTLTNENVLWILAPRHAQASGWAPPMPITWIVSCRDELNHRHNLGVGADETIDWVLITQDPATGEDIIKLSAFEGERTITFKTFRNLLPSQTAQRKKRNKAS